MKPLQKRKMKLKIKLLKGYIVYLIYCIAILILSYYLDRFFPMLMFLIFFETIQNCFLKRFHAETLTDNSIKAVRYCKIITIIVEIIYLLYCKELDVSIYNNLLIIFSVALGNALLQFYVERVVIRKVCLSDIETLNNLCKEANLSPNATKRMIMKYVEHKTYKEIAELEFVDEETIKKSINRSRKKIGI